MVDLTFAPTMKATLTLLILPIAIKVAKTKQYHLAPMDITYSCINLVQVEALFGVKPLVRDRMAPL